MKPIILLVGASLLLGFAACESKTENKVEDVSIGNDTASKEEYKTANFCVDSLKGVEMINRFESIFRTRGGMSINEIIPSIWIEAKAISIINDSLKASNYDGLRIYMGANPIDDKTMFIAVPTLVDSLAKYHPDAWQAEIKMPAGIPSELKINLAPLKAQAAVKHFKKIYRDAGGIAKADSFSIAVWISKELIDRMDSLLVKNPTVLDGYRLYTASYGANDGTPIGGRKYPVQSTILLVPTNKNQGHTDNWSLFRCNEKDAFNHGELCPKNCPPTEPQ